MVEFPLCLCEACIAGRSESAHIHEKIGEKAKEILAERAKIYTEKSMARWTELEIMRLNAAEYKIMRVRIAKTREKALDDLVDAYNYIAFLYDSLAKP